MLKFAHHVCQWARLIQVHLVLLLKTTLSSMMAFFVLLAHSSFKVKRHNICSCVFHKVEISTKCTKHEGICLLKIDNRLIGKQVTKVPV